MKIDVKNFNMNLVFNMLGYCNFQQYIKQIMYYYQMMFVSGCKVDLTLQNQPMYFSV